MPRPGGRGQGVQPDERSAVDLDQLRVRLDRRDGLQVGLCRDFRDHDGAMTGVVEQLARRRRDGDVREVAFDGRNEARHVSSSSGSRPPDSRDGTPSRSTAASQTKCGPVPAFWSVVTVRVPPGSSSTIDVPPGSSRLAQLHAKARQVAAAADRCQRRAARVGRRHPHQQVRRALVRHRRRELDLWPYPARANIVRRSERNHRHADDDRTGRRARGAVTGRVEAANAHDVARSAWREGECAGCPSTCAPGRRREQPVRERMPGCVSTRSGRRGRKGRPRARAATVSAVAGVRDGD